MSSEEAAARRSETLRSSRESLEGALFQREPGQAWVEVHGRLHGIKADERDHPHWRTMHAESAKMQARLKAEGGYTPQLQWLPPSFAGKTDAEREEALTQHAERLALAYALARSPGSDQPIRLTKNLRVCGDCHEAFKAASKVYGRKIIMRDTNAMHKWENGRCSCKDL
jgi:hypothetical protein